MTDDVCTCRVPQSKARFPLPELKARVYGQSNVNSGRKLGPSTRVVETGLNSRTKWLRKPKIVMMKAHHRDNP